MTSARAHLRMTTAVVLGAALGAACAKTDDSSAVDSVAPGRIEIDVSPEAAAALATISADGLAADIRILASDEFEGRGPATSGEEKTIAYLREEFAAIGLQPGNGDSWFQNVPMIAITAEEVSPLIVSGETGVVSGETGVGDYTYERDFMAWTKRVSESEEVTESELVFVGYGVVAPEYGWNDYEGVDVEGKTVVMLVNDPGYATEDPNLFSGRTMTYYGRWTYKFEEAARQGAAAAFVVHETAPAGYPWEVVSGSWSGPQFDLVRPDDNMSRIRIEGWLTVETARNVFARAGLNYDSLKASASSGEFEALPMGLQASLSIRNSFVRSDSRNVLATLPGSDRADEYVIYSAHWDHLGRDPSLEGDQIFNGAHDNATGTAGLLELARAFASQERPPSRSILFLAVTAEEQGLLGSEHYAANPVFGLEKTVALINMDGLNNYGPTEDIIVVGMGMSELDDYLDAAAATQGRSLTPDAESEKGYYYRSDQFSFAKRGVPGLYTDEGTVSREHGPEWMMERKAAYTAERYHKPADEYSEDWDLRGAVEDLQLFFLVGDRLANGTEFPNWREGSEFRAIRDSTLAGGS